MMEFNLNQFEPPPILLSNNAKLICNTCEYAHLCKYRDSALQTYRRIETMEAVGDNTFVTIDIGCALYSKKKISSGRSKEPPPPPRHTSNVTKQT